jgi:hypothetical protein
MSNETPARPSVAKALAMLPIIAILIAGYLALGSMLGVMSLFAGFFFLLYWIAFRHGDMKEFAPALVGSLGGLACAYLIHVLPAAHGIAGIIVAAVLVFAAIYADIRKSCPLALNPAFMLFLTLGTVPPVVKEADFLGMALAILLSASYFGGVLFLITRLTRPQTVASELA